MVRCSAGVAAEATYQLPLGAWTHVACRNDASTLSVWINGAMVASVAAQPIATGGNDGTAVAMNSPSGDNYSGMLDNLRIWRVVRSPEEICVAAGPACTP